MFIFSLPKCKIIAESYFDPTASAQTQQSDSQVLQLRSEQFSATPIQLGE